MLVVGLVPDGARVLEFGCATGYMSEVLRSRKGCTVTGIEISPEAAEIAQEHCDRVIVGDAEELDYDELLGKERFDTILFADVLEHLKQPGDVLERIRPFLSRRGTVIASIPNIAHGSVRLALLAGEFRYRELGLLDSTHLRFFTREGIHDLFEGAGFVITNWLFTRNDIDGTEVRVPAVADVRVASRVASEGSGDAPSTSSSFAPKCLQLRINWPRSETSWPNSKPSAGALPKQRTLRSTVEQQGAFIEGLRERVKALTAQERETHQRLLEANRELLLRDQELARLEAKIARFEERILDLGDERQALRDELDMLQATKVWRAVGKYRQIRDSVLPSVRPTKT